MGATPCTFVSHVTGEVRLPILTGIIQAGRVTRYALRKHHGPVVAGT